MDDERDIVVFEDDEGNEFTMEVIDHIFYEGKEYALLAEYIEDLDEEVEEDEIEIMIMEARPIGDDEEELLPVDDELAQKIIAVIESGELFDDDEDDEEDEG